ncbi:MAG: Crp/Fnr family transcriptional regulator [Desulfobacteraceae bacterium 4572_87]|nr:MAG: Crp/Fnr family transcriptional regulator [Desulfobacteraceae bacterium 4572_87]
MNPEVTMGKKICYNPEIFQDLSHQQYSDLLKNGRCINLSPKTILFHQGDSASSCFLVTRGRLKLTKLNEQGKEIILRYIGPGELTAAISVLKDSACPVTAEAIEETDVTGWDQSTMVKMMHRYPDIAISLLNIVLERIEDVQNRYMEVCTERVDQRIARSLLRLMRRAGSRTGNGILIDIPLSRGDIADYSGTTLYTVSRTLSAWEKKGWIRSGRERIVITDPHAMVQFSEAG